MLPSVSVGCLWVSRGNDVVVDYFVLRLGCSYWHPRLLLSFLLASEISKAISHRSERSLESLRVDC